MIKGKEKIFLTIGLLFVALSIGSYIHYGFNLSPDFAGNSKFTISYSGTLEDLGEVFPNADVRRNDALFDITVDFLNETEHEEFIDRIEEVGVVNAVESVSPSISNELVRKSFIAIIIASLLIILFISFAFRKVSRPVSSWKYGLVATVALIHDSIIPVGIFSFIGQWTSAEVDVLFVTAILAVLGYSVNDTIVIFDRIRERLFLTKKENFEDSVSYGVSNSIRRSIFTSLSTIIPLVLLFIFVPITKWFALTLFIGVVFGTYSSLFFAPSILILLNKYLPERNKEEKEMSELERAEKELFSRLKNK